MNQLKTIVLLGALSALVVAAGGALGPQWLWGSVALALDTSTANLTRGSMPRRPQLH